MCIRDRKKTLAEKYYFEEMEREKDGTVVRFCTSWATKQEEVDALVLDISKQMCIRDSLQPVFRKASVVAWQAPMGPRSPLCFGRRRADTPGCFTAVSYTHLDVYKRQGIHNRGWQNCLLQT